MKRFTRRAIFRTAISALLAGMVATRKTLKATPQRTHHVIKSITISPDLYSALLWGYRTDLVMHYTPVNDAAYVERSNRSNPMFAGMLSKVIGGIDNTYRMIQVWVDNSDTTSFDEDYYYAFKISRGKPYFLNVVFVRRFCPGYPISTTRRLKHFFEYLDAALLEVDSD